MKIKGSIFLKTTLMITLSLSILLAGTMYAFAAPSAEKDVATDFVVPDGASIMGEAHLTIFDKVVNKAVNDGTAPPTAGDYASKYDVYTTVSIEDGKSVATVYTPEQIAELNSGQWNVLTGDEALWLLDDTMKLFESYDVIRIVNKNGETVSYTGASFYTSDEYFDSFGLVTEDDSDISYNLKQDIFNAMLTRLEVLASASGRFSISGHGNEGYVFLGRGPGDPYYIEYEADWIDYYYTNPHRYLLPEEIGLDHWCEDCDADKIRCEWCDQGALSELCFHNNYSGWVSCRERLAGKDYGILWFENGRIYYVADLSRADHRDEICLYPNQLFDRSVGNIKYDSYGEKVAVIEVWDTASESVIARLRLDNEKNPEEIARLEALWLYVQKNTDGAPPEDYFIMTDYRVAVYLNGFAGEWGNYALRYAADGNPDYWAFQNEDDILMPLFLTGAAEISSYVNSLLSEAFPNQ